MPDNIDGPLANLAESANRPDDPVSLRGPFPRHATAAAAQASKAGRFAWPVAVMSFGRPNLLAAVLRDLRNQTISLADEQVYLFQDGNVDPYTDKVLIEDSVKNACIALFKEAFPGGRVAPSEMNLGIALNFERAERTTLGSSGAEAAAFFEDDMVLSEFYLEALAKLMEFALTEDKVGYVAAYGEHRASLEQQTAQRNKIIPMRHKWGFGLTKRQWERQQPIIEPYLRLLEGKNYVRRDHAKIAAYFDNLGYPCAASSQDAAKDVAGNVLGTTKLMCFVCYGKYIGEVGIHQTAEEYRKAGYSDTAMFPFSPEAFDFPNSQRLDQIILNQRAAFRAFRPQASATPTVSARGAADVAQTVPAAASQPADDIVNALFRAVLKRPADQGALSQYGRFFASLPLPDAIQRTGESLLRSTEYAAKIAPVTAYGSPATPDATPQAPAVPAAATAPPPPAANLGKPHLFGAEPELLARIMSQGHRRYQEFGIGGSTVLAIRSGLERIVAIDSDPGWVSAVRGHTEVAGAIATGRAMLRHADIGPVKEWGNPGDGKYAQKWPNYIRTAWDIWSELGEMPDLVFVDGRFRVACCLSVILAASGDAKLLDQLRVVLHDVGPERPHYDEVLEFFDVVEAVNTLRVMKIKPRIVGSRVLSVMLRRQFDQQ